MADFVLDEHLLPIFFEFQINFFKNLGIGVVMDNKEYRVFFLDGSSEYSNSFVKYRMRKLKIKGTSA